MYETPLSSRTIYINFLQKYCELIDQIYFNVSKVAGTDGWMDNMMMMMKAAGIS